MARYSTSFQCPETGQMVMARYAAGRATLEPLDDDLVASGHIGTEFDRD